MLCDVAKLFASNDDARLRWASRWDFVIQDEAQDQNPVQIKIGEALSQDHKNYMLVGDPAQSIYGFRGAEPSLLLSFEDRWNSKVFRMGRNYRCCGLIVEAANDSLQEMEPSTHLGIKMICERGVAGSVTSAIYEDLDDEAANIVESITAKIVDGVQPKEISVLYRVNAQSRAPEEALLAARLPYIIVGGTHFYERAEIKALLAYVRIAAGRGAFDDVKRAICNPSRFLGKKFFDAVEKVAARRNPNWPDALRSACNVMARINKNQKAAAEDLADLLEYLTRGIEKGIVPGRLLEAVVSDTGYTDWLIRDEGEESPENSRVSNVKELIRAAERFPTVDELLDYIDNVIAQSRAKRKGENDNAIILSTIHKSKGLEWPNVYMIGVNQGILPCGWAEDKGEEHRLFYVGVTRARDSLHVSCVRKIAIGAKVVDTDPSEFALQVGMFRSYDSEK